MGKDLSGEKFIQNGKRFFRRKIYSKWGKISQEKNSSKMRKDNPGEKFIRNKERLVRRKIIQNGER